MSQKIPIITFCALLSSILTFAWYNNWIILNFPAKTTPQEHITEHSITKKEVPFFFFKNNAENCEKKELLWSTKTEKNIQLLVQTWLTLLDEEELLAKKSSLQIVSLNQNKTTAFISFDRPPFNDESPTFKKLIAFETLLKTIRTSIPFLKSVQFLTHHQIINDYHLDFSRPWPVDGFLQAKPLIKNDAKKWSHKKTVTIMLDPAGDAQNTGRIIGDNFERGITLQYAQKLKKALEELIPYARIILTRFPGETLEPLQNAAFSNRLNADIYISINFYPALNELSRCFIYNLVYDPTTDFWHKKQKRQVFLPYNAAHLNQLNKSCALTNTIYANLKPLQNQGLFALEPIYRFPFKPIIGVQAASFGFEIGLHQKDDWQLFVKPLAQAIKAAL